MKSLRLKNYTESLGLIYLSTPFSRSAANFLDEIGVEAFKIGSGEADNLPLIEHVANFGKPIIMSTGMHSFSRLKVAWTSLKNMDWIMRSSNAQALIPQSQRQFDYLL